MVKAARHTGLVCALALLSVFTIHAKDLAAYRIGDTAEEDISTPVALDVIDTDATIARRAEESLKTPAIFRNYPEVTNAMADEVTAAFAQAHSDFLASLQDTFHQPVLDEATILSPNFGYFVTAFNLKNKKFPITTDLGQRWARGDAGLDVESSLVGLLAQSMHRSVRADDLPAGFTLGDMVRLVPVRNAKEALNLNDAEQRGRLATRTSIATLSHLRALFRQNFPADDQLVAQALAGFLRPNCEPDPDLTQQARDREVGQLVVADHYNAGQLIVRRGQTIDSKIQTALGELNEKLLPGQLNQQIAAARSQAQQEQDQAQREHQLALQQSEQAKQELERVQEEHAQMLKAHDEALDLQNQALKSRARFEWLLAALAVVSALTLLVFWRLVLHRRRASSLPARVADSQMQNQLPLPANLAPQLAQVLKSAVVQELAAQRRELLQTQQNAASEIIQLVHRLDELHAPLQERLSAYQTRIQELEKELAVRTEENRELLTLKIEMLRQQLEVERTRPRTEFN
jgi:hypothetical protein